MKGFTRAAGLAVLVFALGTATVALGTSNTIHISVSPSSGKVGSVYTITVHGRAHGSGDQVAITITTIPGKCAASYTKGFSTQSGIADSNGDPIGPKRVKPGSFNKIFKAKITSGDPGVYGVCAYLQYGSVTRAHAATTFTITQ